MKQNKETKDSAKPESKSPVSFAIAPLKVALAVCPVDTAVRMLQNNASTVVTSLPGGLSEVKTAFPSELVVAARGLFKANKPYRFRMHGSSTLATIAGGVFNQTISWSPATTTFAEWTALAALFDEVKLERAGMIITSAFGPQSTGISFQVAIAPDFTTASGSTPSFTTVSRLAESEYIHNYHLGGLEAPGRRHKVARVPARDYATTAAPAGASGMVAGCLGHWAFASNIVGTATINYLFIALEHDVLLRLRA